MQQLLKQLKSKKLSTEEKHKLINKEYSCPKMQRIQRDYALICASRAVEECNIQEIKDFFTLCILINQTEDFSSRDTEEYRIADRAAFWAANWSSNRAASWAASWVANRAAYWTAERAAYWAASWAANRASYWAANWAADREIQVEIFISLLEA